MHAFYGSRLSGHISQTPEGFLICHGARLSRTAVNTPQKYRGTEIGLSTDDEVSVYRSAEEVTNRASLASLEGKPVCDNHPGQFLTSENIGWYGKGHVQHVREGDPLPDGERVIVGDLVITDSGLIAKIKGDLRSISVGYDCEYTPRGDGSYTQAKIRANHIAVVRDGRAGREVRILDSAGKPRLSFADTARQFHRRNVPEVAAGLVAASAVRAIDSLVDDWAEAQRLNDETVKQSLVKFGVLKPEEVEDIVQRDTRIDRILEMIQQLIAEETNDELVRVNDAVPRRGQPTAEQRTAEARDYELSLKVYRNRAPSEGKRIAEEQAASRQAKPTAQVADAVEDADRKYENDIRAIRRQMLSAQR